MAGLNLLIAACCLVPSVGQQPVDHGSTLSFLVMGDWGGLGSAPYTTAAEQKAATAMATVAEREGSSFVLAVGDNFYEWGIPNDAAKAAVRFQSTFEKGEISCDL